MENREFTAGKVAYMRVKNNFILREIAEEYLLIPVGEAAISVKGLIALSESGCLLYRKLQSGCSREDLLAAILEEYDITAQTAAEDLDSFLSQMRQLDMLVED